MKFLIPLLIWLRPLLTKLLTIKVDRLISGSTQTEYAGASDIVRNITVISHQYHFSIAILQ